MPSSPRRLDLDDLAASLKGGGTTEAGAWLMTQLPEALDMYRLYMDPCGDEGDTEDWLRALAAITAGMDRMDNAQAAGPQSEPIVV